MKPAVKLALTALKQHIDDAAIAAQIPRPSAKQFLAKCRRVRLAQAKLKAKP